MRAVAFFSLVALSTSVFAQPGEFQGKKLTVTPAAESIPALRYELVPKQRTSGNAALAYIRAAQLRPAPERDPEKANIQEKTIQSWEEAPLEKLPLAEVRAYLDRYKSMFREVESGSRCDRCDWQLDLHRGMELLDTLLPSIQTHRELTRYYSLRIKLEIAEKKYDDAIHSSAIGLQFGKRVAEGPSFIQMLVGIAISNIYLHRLEDLIRQPNSPNLYWALTTLPRPFIDPRPGLEGETRFLDAVFLGYEELRTSPVTPQRAQEISERMLKTLKVLAGNEADPIDGLITKVGFGAYVALHHASAKKELLARGRPAAEVDAMPPAQVVVLNSLERVRVLSDDQKKWFLAPAPEGREALRKMNERVKLSLKENRSDVLFNLFALSLPASEKVFQAHTRIERLIAMLRTIEAIRMYAVDHGGQPPSKLEEITAVPVPLDPQTGKSFEYTTKDQTFILNAPPPPGEIAHPGNSLHYEITLRAKP